MVKFLESLYFERAMISHRMIAIYLTRREIGHTFGRGLETKELLVIDKDLLLWEPIFPIMIWVVPQYSLSYALLTLLMWASFVKLTSIGVWSAKSMQTMQKNSDWPRPSQ